MTAALLLGIVATTLLWLQAVDARKATDEQEKLTRLEAARAETVIALIDGMLGSADPHESKDPNYTLRELLDRFDRELEGHLPGHPLVEASVRSTMGRAYSGIGNLDKAEQHLAAALEIRRREPSLTVDLAETLVSWAWLLHDRGDYGGAEVALREALGILEKAAGDRSSEADISRALSDMLRHSAQYQQAEEAARKALALDRAFLGDVHPDVAESMGSLASVLRASGDYAESERLFREALALNRKLLGDEHPSVATNLAKLGTLLEAKGDYAAAEGMLREALAIRKKLLGDENPSVAASLNELASLLVAKGDYAAAEAMSRESLAMHERLLGDEHPFVAKSLDQLASLLKVKGGLRRRRTNVPRGAGDAQEATG